MTTDPSDIVERRGIAPEAIIATLRTAMDWAGTLPAREAVKVRPTDWHAIERVMRESADEITSLRAALAEQKEACARVADAAQGSAPEDEGPVRLWGWLDACEHIAAAIRAGG